MSIYRGSQKIKELRFGGSQKIKEAYVGGQLVYKGGWDANPADGIMFTAAGVAYVEYSGFMGFVTGTGWYVRQRSSGVITGVVFGENTTQFTIRLLKSLSAGRALKISIDDELIGTVYTSGNNSVEIPAKFIDENTHTVTLYDQSTENAHFSTLYFNV